MDKEVLKELEIEDTDLAKIKEDLDIKQVELEERLDNVQDEKRRVELQDELNKVNEQLKLAEEELKAAASKPEEEKHAGAVPTALDPEREKALTSSAGAVPVAHVEKEKKAEPNKDKQKEAVDNSKHEDELLKKANELASKKKKEAKEIAKADARNQASADNQTNGASSSISSEDVKNGISAYHSGDFTRALSLLEKVSNGGINANVDKKSLGIAQYLTAKIYKDGQGVTQDDKRAQYWFEAAALNDSAEANLECGIYYASLTTNSVDEIKTYTKKSLDYFQRAAELGNKAGRSKYVEKLELQINMVGFHEKNQAKSYLDEMINEEQDEYLKQKLRERKKAISKNHSKTPGKKSSSKSGSAVDYVSVVGGILIMLGAFYFVRATIYYNYGIEFFSFLPKATSAGIVIPFIESLFGYNSYDLYRGMRLLLIGGVLAGFTCISDRGKIPTIICDGIMIITIASIFDVIRLYPYCLEEDTFIYIFVALIHYVVGYVVGKIVGDNQDWR